MWPWDDFKQNPDCTCRACNPRSPHFIVCSVCGNKRCPKATDHKLECTGSNEAGQPGSVYGPPLDSSAATRSCERARALAELAERDADLI